MSSTDKPPFPPFSAETAQKKVKAAQDLWNTRYRPTLSVRIRPTDSFASNRDPSRVKHGYTFDSIWRNRDTFLQGHDQIVEFLTKKWEKENGYRLRKELFSFTDNKASLAFVRLFTSLTTTHAIDRCPILV